MAGAELTLSPERACFILLRAREVEARTAQTNPASASNPADERGVSQVGYSLAEFADRH